MEYNCCMKYDTFSCCIYYKMIPGSVFSEVAAHVLLIVNTTRGTSFKTHPYGYYIKSMGDCIATEYRKPLMAAAFVYFCYTNMKHNASNVL